MADKKVRIGGASGFWGDSSVGAPQLVRHGDIDYLVFDYLAETTMSILQRARLRAPELGYATDFVTAAVGPHLREIKARGVRLVSNAGGLTPAGCRDAILALAREQGVAVADTKSSLTDVVTAADREAERLVAEEGFTMIPPFDHPAVVAGQGTLGLEIIEQTPDVETVLIQVSGGGLAAGVAKIGRAHV